MQHTLLHTVVYGTHSGWCRQEKSKVARELRHKVFCLVWSVLKEVLVKKAENDSPCCFSWLEMSICYLASISVLPICTFTTVFIWSSKYGTNNHLVLFSTLCWPLDAGFRLRENAVGALELLSGQKFPHRKWRKPRISTLKRTQQNISQRCPMFGSKGPPWIPPPWIEPRTVATLALTARRSDHSSGSHPQLV